IPSDYPQRKLNLARPETDHSLPHIGLVGDTYTILLSGEDTHGRFCLIDMHVPPSGGPPHPRDFEESFTVLNRQVEATFRGKRFTVRAGETLLIPANRHIPSPMPRSNRRDCYTSARRQASRILAERRYASSNAHHTSAEARQGRTGRVHQKGAGTWAEVSN